MPTNLISQEQIESAIYVIRGQKVMIDRDLGRLYGVETRVLLQSVRRNADRFPDDFMFQLNSQELENWRSQFVMSNSSTKMGLRRAPYVFTEQGVAMLSSVLRSPQAIQVNIEIMRAFVSLRRTLDSHDNLHKKIEEMEASYDEQFRIVFEAIRKLMEPPIEEGKRKIGFQLENSDD